MSSSQAIVKISAQDKFKAHAREYKKAEQARENKKQARVEREERRRVERLARQNVVSSQPTPPPRASKPRKPRPVRPSSVIVLDKNATTAVPAIVFGKVVRMTHTGFTIPYHQANNVNDSAVATRIEAILKNDSLLSLMMFTLLRRAFNTVNGKVGIFFATLATSTATFPVAVCHYAMIQRLCIQCYSVFSPRTVAGGVRKEDIIKTLSSFVALNIHVADLASLGERTGANPMTKTRVKQHSHIVMSAYFLRYVAIALLNVKTLKQLLCSDDATADGWCTDRRMTIRGLKQYKTFDVSAYLMVRTPQSLFHASAHFPTPLNPNDPVYTDTTPSFGVEWSDMQLRELASVYAFFSGRAAATHHCTSFYDAARTQPIRTRSAIIDSMPGGVENDSHLRAATSSNFAHQRDLEDIARELDDVGLDMPSRGRPSHHNKNRAEAKRMLLKRKQDDRGRRVLKRQKRVIGVADTMDPAVLQRLNVTMAQPVTVDSIAVGVPIAIDAGAPVPASLAVATVVAPVASLLAAAVQDQKAADDAAMENGVIPAHVWDSMIGELLTNA